MAGRSGGEGAAGTAPVSAIVLAAGSATRMGEQKLLLPLEGRPLVQRAVDAALGSKATETIVVVGREASSVREALADRPVTIVVNPEYAQGMSTSLQAGLRAVRQGCGAVVVLLGDQPFVTAALVDRLIERFAETGAGVVRPVVKDRQTNPVLMSAALFGEILAQRGDVGGREIVKCHPEQVCLVPVEDANVEVDVDTDEDYEAALRLIGPPCARKPLALIKGAGDLASGVAVRLHRAGFAVVMTEVALPTAVRRTVAFAEAVYEGRTRVEGVEGVLAAGVDEVWRLFDGAKIPVIVDPAAAIGRELAPELVVDAIVAKRNLGTHITDAQAVVALGPGFVAGRDVHAVIETKRGHTLGRVIIQGEALPDTGIPGEVEGFGEERVLRSPDGGVFVGLREIGAALAQGEIVGYVRDAPVRAGLDGVLRGMIHSGLEVTPGFKLGDVDPRATREHCFQISDKALAIAGGVLEAACILLGGVRFQVDR